MVSKQIRVTKIMGIHESYQNNRRNEKILGELIYRSCVFFVAG